MPAIFYILVFLFGLVIGSFLNCVIYRLAAPSGRASPSEAGRERGESFLAGRSYCPHCKHKLGVFDLVPVLSFIWLRGRCRYCRKRISWQYPLVELVTGMLFALSATYYINNAMALSMQWVIFCFLIIIFVYDLKHYIIPDKVIYSAIGLALIRYLYLGFTKSPLILGDFVNPLISAFSAAAFFAAIVLFSRGRWMGAGDIKLAFLMGLILGWPNILAALFLAFMFGAIIGVGLIIFGKKKFKSEVPFGPFLVVGTFIALFWGEKLINWYLRFL